MKINEFCCLMIKLRIPKWNNILNSIKDSDICEIDGIGKEHTCHSTILYGIHSDVEPENVKKLSESVFPSIHINLTKIDMFENDGFDVLKFNVESFEMTTLNKIMKLLPHTSTYPVYNPHVTIAYLKPGCAKKYITYNIIINYKKIKLF